MARLLLSQYIYQNKNKNKKYLQQKGGQEQKDYNTKSEDKGNNNTGTVVAHAGKVASDKDKTGASSDGSSIGTHVSDVTETIVISTQCEQDILAAHPIGKPIYDSTDPYDILIDTVNSAEAMAGAHVADQEFQEYYNGRDQQYSAFKYNKGFKQVGLKLAPAIIKEDRLCDCMDQYDTWDNTPYISVADSDMGSSHTFT